jgi:hypothetical protein
MVLEIFFAAGCFWGVEKNFEQIEGVVDVVSGYSGGNYDNPTYSDILENRNLKGGGFLEYHYRSDCRNFHQNSLIQHQQHPQSARSFFQPPKNSLQQKIFLEP